MTLRRRAELAITAAAMIWGFSFVVAKNALADMSPVLYLFVRFLLGAALLAAITHRHLRQWPSPATQRFGLLAGACLGVGMILQMMGLRETSAANCGFLTALFIPLVPFANWIVYRVSPGWREVGAIVVSVLGIALLTLESNHIQISRGDLYSIGGAVLFAFQVLFVTRAGQSGNAAWTALFQMAVTALVCLVMLPLAIDGGMNVRWTIDLGIAMAISVFGATVLAFLLQSWGQRHTTANRAALLYATEPVFAALAGTLFLRERLPERAWLGAALILGAIVLVELKPTRPTEHTSN
jgi:drug/metabolite transporter (DMT)-like permease